MITQWMIKANHSCRQLGASNYDRKLIAPDHSYLVWVKERMGPKDVEN
jgi:hypothetical protein